MVAVIGPHSIAFANVVADGFHGTIREHVKLDPIPEDYNVWEDGDEAPQQILGESESEPGHYRMFKYEREIIRSGFRRTGKNFGGLFDVYPRML
jgi:hypothetical protein